MAQFCTPGSGSTDLIESGSETLIFGQKKGSERGRLFLLNRKIMPGVGNGDTVQEVPGPVTPGGAGEERNFRSSQAHRGNLIDCVYYRFFILPRRP
jgi:hypothetical protein